MFTTVMPAGIAVHKRRFNDKYQDDISALVYYGVRYLDKTLIGWTQSDPVSRFAPDAAWLSPRKSGLYTFSLNNSLRYIDPDGAWPQDDAGTAVQTVAQGAKAVAKATEVGAALVQAEAAMKRTTFIAKNMHAPNVVFGEAPLENKGLGPGNLLAGAGLANLIIDTAEGRDGPVDPTSAGGFGPKGAGPGAGGGGTGLGGGAGLGGSGGNGTGGGRGGNQFRGPDPAAQGPHTRIRSDAKGVTNYETYDYPTPGVGKRVDVVGSSHGGVPTPHTVETQRFVNPKDSTKSYVRESRPRPSSADEIPARKE